MAAVGSLGWPGSTLVALFLEASIGACGLALPARAVSEDPSDDAVAELLRDSLDQLQVTGLVVDGTELTARRALPLVYEANGYRPFWTADRLADLVRVVRDSASDGLTPDDYHLAALVRQASPGAAVGKDPRSRANADLLATDAFATLLVHLYEGKVDPKSLDPHWNFELRPIEEKDAVAFLTDALTSGRLADAVAEVRPKHWWYERARASLARYRDLAASGGWPTIPPGRALKEGVVDSRVPVLRRRLAATGDFAGEPSDSQTFDAPLANAVRAFQARHRIEADGAIGAGTLAELNVAVEKRIEQIRVNLERGRWVLHDIPAGNLVLVDVAGFDFGILRDEKALWTGRIQIGKPYRQTPIFHSKIDTVVFNPTWTVPPGILRHDVLPAVRRDPGYLAKKNLDVLDRSGKPVDPATIDWARASGGNFPYIVRQEPGPDNALGRVKFLFPNPYSVYLHDTPSKSLFEKEERAFSSGCIRVERPLELAALLLDDAEKWNPDAIAKVVAQGETKTVRLRKSVPVLLMYWTIVPGDEGRTVFKRDPYGRDPRLARALDEPPAFRGKPSR